MSKRRGRVRDARRPARRDRRRRHPVLHAPRSHDRTLDLDLDLARTPVARRTPSTTSSTPTPGSRRCCARLPRGARRGCAGRQPTGVDGGLQPAERELIKKLVAFPERDRRGGRAPRHRTGSPPTRSSWPRTSPRSTSSAGSSARARGGRVVPDRAVAGGPADDRDCRWGCSGSAPRSRCSRRPPRSGLSSSSSRRSSALVQRRARRRRAARPRPPAPAVASGAARTRARDADQHDRRRKDVDGQVEPVRGRLAEHRLAVLADERLLDLGLGLALRDQMTDEVALGFGLRGLGDRQRLVAGHAHHVVLDVGQRARGASSVSAAWASGAAATRDHASSSSVDREPEPHDACLRIEGRVWSSHLLSTWNRRSAAILPSRLITNVSGTPVVPNERTKLPLTSRTTG